MRDDAAVAIHTYFEQGLDDTNDSRPLPPSRRSYEMPEGWDADKRLD
jgi:hypothetical protein